MEAGVYYTSLNFQIGLFLCHIMLAIHVVDLMLYHVKCSICLLSTQLAHDFDPALSRCWPGISDAVPTFRQRCVNVCAACECITVTAFLFLVHKRRCPLFEETRNICSFTFEGMYLPLYEVGYTSHDPLNSRLHFVLLYILLKTCYVSCKYVHNLIC